jgi:hypothetical protein
MENPFTQVVVSDSAALLLSFLNFLQLIALGLMGGIVYLLSQVSPVGVARQESTR